ncbi:MAG: glycosyltransferase [Alphaproteobacteria bacterium]|nr:glycosyltransferase [Alphaproteobacteria bacterium]
MADFSDIGLLSLDPPITYSTRQPAAPLGIAWACPELFSGRPSLHFVSFSWALFDRIVSEIASEVETLSARLPEARIVFLTATDYDIARFSRHSLAAIPGNPSIFVDERIFKPLPPFDFSDAAFDAIYNARFVRFKRHELTYRLQRPAFIYDPPLDVPLVQTEAATRAALPDAHYLNHEHGKGSYIRLDRETIAREVNRARCGLCLSAVEGFMTASMEYLLCGIPVISTESIGGRDRYYDGAYAFGVEPNAEAVAAAVAAIRNKRFNKLQIREQVGRLVQFERRNLLSAINRISREAFGIPDVFQSLTSFVAARPFALPTGWARPRFEAAASELGRTLGCENGLVAQ